MGDYSSVMFYRCYGFGLGGCLFPDRRDLYHPSSWLSVLEKVITVKKRVHQNIFAKHLCARNSHHDIKLIA